MAAVVFDEAGRVLLGRRLDNGLWGLPSGHVEVGETAAQAAVREVAEETGLQVQVQRLVGVYSDPASQVFAYPDGRVTQFVTTTFACLPRGGQDVRQVFAQGGIGKTRPQFRQLRLGRQPGGKARAPRLRGNGARGAGVAERDGVAAAHTRPEPTSADQATTRPSNGARSTAIYNGTASPAPTPGQSRPSNHQTL